MSFRQNDLSEQKQYINLSDTACDTIEMDMKLFSCDNRNRFINTVFCNFRDFAKASISRTLEKEKEELEKKLAGVVPAERKKCIQALLKYKEAELTALAGTYEKGTGIRIRISNDNYAYLTEDPDCKEEKYYNNRIGRYLKTILEEYCRLPLPEREQYYYTDMISEINTALAKKKMLKITTQKGKMHRVLPYGVETDRQANYLVGIRKSDNEAYPDTEISFRLSNIKECKEYDHGTLSSALKMHLAKELKQKGCQFLSSDSTKIIVELTEEGIRQYHLRRHLRPDGEIKGNRLELYCTETQVLYYFFSFGKDVNLIAPDSLAKKFRDRYMAALDNYKDIQTVHIEVIESKLK